ncbi:MAG: hypothetical protein RL308_3021, partial [Bacteroidota bacterium]
MKKIVLILLIIFTTNAFSQTYSDSSSGKFDKMSDLANHNKDDEAKKIADELLSGKYGELSGFEKFYTLLVVADYYYQKDDYQKASDSYQQFLDFNKNENPKKIDNKKIYLDEAKGKLEELKPKLSLVSANTTNTVEVTDAAKDEPNKTSETKSLDVNIASENSAIEADKKETNTDKTVTLTVSGTGKTIEEARLNALRSAIEQAFGAFISSKTEILNDNLVKDEIVSIANGNVQKYDVVSQVEIPNNGYAITLSATVSISKLTSFAVSKGVEVEFKGGMFAQNIKLQKLNEQSEEKATKNLVEVYLQLLENSFDFSLVSSEPELVKGQSDVYKINFIVKTVANENYNNFIQYFKETLDKVAAIDDEAANIIKVGKPIYSLIIDDKVYKFRNINSFHYIDKFFISSQLLATSFKVTSNLDIYKYSFKEIFTTKRPPPYGDSNFLFTDNSNKSLLSVKVMPYGADLNRDSLRSLSALFPFYIKNNTQYKSLTEIYNIQICSIKSNTRIESSLHDFEMKFLNEKDKYLTSNYYQNENFIDIDGRIYFKTNFQHPIY